MPALSALLALLLLLRAVPAQVSQAGDWLNAPLSAAAPSTLDESTPGLLTLSNGLLSRTFAIAPCFATVDLELHAPPTKLFRGLSPEATLTLNGTATAIGGCNGQAYFDFFSLESVNLTQPPSAFRYLSHATYAPTAPYPWTAGQRHSPPGTAWPPRGLHLAVTLGPPQGGAPFNGSDFSQYPGMGFPCAGDACLRGFPSCDNATLPGQCVWGSQAEALQECAKWGACLGVNCHLAYPYCSARGGPVDLFAIGDYVSYVRTNSSLYPLGDTTVVIHYEIYDGLPALRKWVEVRQGAASPGAVLVDDLVVEQFRAPNFVPDQMSVLLVQPNNPTPFDDQVVPSPSQSFPGRTQQLWYSDPNWDQGGDAELHVPYSYYTLLSVGYDGAGPGAVVAPGGAPFASVSVRLIYHDSAAWERKGLGVRKVQAALAPQMLDNPTRYMITDISSNDTFQLAITQAAAAGFEMVIVGYGAAGYCGMCPGQLTDAAWVAWFKSNVDFARSKGVAVSAYTLMQHNGWGESVPAAEQVLNADGSRGGIACFATAWHAAYRASVLAFVQAVGLAGVETDGQYEGAVCHDSGGDHAHNGERGSWDAQTAATADFNAALKGLGVYQTGADAYYFSGANSWNHADTDAGFSVPTLWHRLQVGRDYVYDSTTSRLKTSGMYPVNALAEQSTECGAPGTPQRLACADFALASFYAQGVIPNPMGASLARPSDPDAPALLALFAAWNAFYAAHRPILTSVASLHLARPTSRSVEATAHVDASPAAGERALLSLFNPAGTPRQGALALPLYYAGLAPGAGVSVASTSSASAPLQWAFNATVGADARGGVYDIMVPYALPPKSYALFIVTAI